MLRSQRGWRGRIDRPGRREHQDLRRAYGGGADAAWDIADGRMRRGAPPRGAQLHVRQIAAQNVRPPVLRAEQEWRTRRCVAVVVGRERKPDQLRGPRWFAGEVRALHAGVSGRRRRLLIQGGKRNLGGLAPTLGDRLTLGVRALTEK